MTNDLYFEPYALEGRLVVNDRVVASAIRSLRESEWGRKAEEVQVPHSRCSSDLSQMVDVVPVNRTSHSQEHIYVGFRHRRM